LHEPWKLEQRRTAEGCQPSINTSDDCATLARKAKRQRREAKSLLGRTAELIECIVAEELCYVIALESAYGAFQLHERIAGNPIAVAARDPTKTTEDGIRPNRSGDPVISNRAQ
jgi:hypothetical protein